MSKYTGRQIHFGIGVETTRGTKATSKTWIPKTSFSFDDKIETKEDESSLGGKIDISGIEVVREMGEGNIEMKASANNIGYFLYSILGKKQTSTVTASKVFSHLFTINDDTENPSLTIFTKEPNGDTSYPLALIKSLTLSAQVGEPITIQAEFISKKGVSDTHTTNYDLDYTFKPKHSKFKIANKESALNSAPMACIESFELTINKENLEVLCLNNGNEPVDIMDGKISITWGITAVFSDNDYKEKALNGEEFAMYFGLEDQSIEIAGESDKYPSLEFTIPKTKITDYGRDKGNDSLVKVNLSGKVYKNESSVEPIKVKLQNGISNY